MHHCRTFLQKRRVVVCNHLVVRNEVSSKASSHLGLAQVRTVTPLPEVPLRFFCGNVPVSFRTTSYIAEGGVKETKAPAPAARPPQLATNATKSPPGRMCGLAAVVRIQ